MIEFAKITGKLDNNLLQVRMRTGEQLYAPIVTVGTNVSLPSEKWILDNKDNFLALVTYEKDLYISPMIIGFYPVKGADSQSYNTTERLITVMEKLIEQLSKAKVNTQLGPQTFMPDTLVVLDELSEDVNSIKSLINPLKL